RQRGVGLADPDVECDEAAALREHAARSGDLVRLELGRLWTPAGDLQRLGREGRDDAAASDAVVRADALLAPTPDGGDPRLERIGPLLRQGDPPLGEAPLLGGPLLAGRRSGDAVALLLRRPEQLGVVVVVAEEREGLRGERGQGLVGVVVAADLDEAALAL